MPEQTGQKYDTTIKHLFAGNEEALVEYFSGITLEDAETLNIEFKLLEKRSSDLVVRGLTAQGPAICHLEFQTTSDSKMHLRMLRYSIEVCDLYGDFPYQVLLYLGASPPHMKNSLSYHRGELGRLDYQYRLVDIGSLTRDSLKASKIPELYALLPLAERENRKKEPDRFLRECVDDIIDSPMELEEKQKTLVMTEIFAGLAFGKVIIERIFKGVMDMFDIRQSAGYQLIKEEGIQEGIEKGIEKGKREALSEITLRQLRKKFKKLPTEYLEKIKSQDVLTLETIAENIFEIEKLEDLDQYLA
ncbi:MAG: DUF4351 domain-containing protein [Firmicutes bacterium]|nr:DUF4351 domain-containing protein [Bacillota bacterium]